MSPHVPWHGELSNASSYLSCFPGKKDAEGWETVQRGRTAKPRSAAIVAKVISVPVKDPPKQDSVKCKQSHPPPKEERPIDAVCPSNKDTTQKDDEQQVPLEPNPLVEVGCPVNGNMMEVLRFSTVGCFSPKAVPWYQLFTRRRVTLPRFISHICFCFGLLGYS